MGISTEQWRTKIGAFLPVIRSMSRRQRRVWPQRKRVRTYKRPPDEPKTHHVTMAIFICLLAIALACLTSSEDPLKEIRLQGGDLVALNGLVMYLGVSHKKALGTWQERLTIALRMALFVLLLMCGDVESNPGPSGSEKPVMTPWYSCVVDHMSLDIITRLSLIEWRMRIRPFIQPRRHEPSTTNQEKGKRTQREMSRGYSTSRWSALRLAIVAIVMILIAFAHIRLERAGDVERNPGPRTTIDKELLALSRRIEPSSYYDVGIHLGFEYAELSNIQLTRQGNVQDALLEVLHKWKVKQPGDIDVRAELASVLRKLKLNSLADALLSGSATGATAAPPLTAEQVAQCRADLQRYYRTYLCRIRSNPLNFDTLVDFEDIFTNLSLLEEKNKERRHLDYYDLLNVKVNGQRCKRLMVEGEAGAGKTTLCAKIAWDWINGRGCTEFGLVLLVPLRELKGNVTVGGIIKTYLSDTNTSQAGQIDDYILRNPDKVFIIFDGLDEFGCDLKEPRSDNEIVQALMSIRFKSCLVMVTTRPWKAREIRCDENLRNAYAFIRVDGFNKKNLAEYVSKYFKDDKCTADDLIQFMNENDAIAENMAPYPIYSAITV